MARTQFLANICLYCNNACKITLYTTFIFSLITRNNYHRCRMYYRQQRMWKCSRRFPGQLLCRSPHSCHRYSHHTTPHNHRQCSQCHHSQPVYPTGYSHYHNHPILYKYRGRPISIHHTDTRLWIGEFWQSVTTFGRNGRKCTTFCSGITVGSVSGATGSRVHWVGVYLSGHEEKRNDADLWKQQVKRQFLARLIVNTSSDTLSV